MSIEPLEAVASSDSAQIKSVVPIGALSESPAVKKDFKIAVIGIHGIGTHLPMTTLKDAALHVRRSVPKGSKFNGHTVISSVTTEENHVLTKAEFGYVHDGVTTNVSVFEGYYSPFLKGKATVVDVLTFLIKSGVGSLWKKTLGRSIFQNSKNTVFKGGGWSTFYLLITILAICSLILINAEFVEIVAKGVANAPLDQAHYQVAAWGANLFLAIAVLYGLLSGFTQKASVGAEKKRRKEGEPADKTPGSLKTLGDFSYLTFFLLLIALIAVASLLLAARMGAPLSLNLPVLTPGCLVGIGLLVGAISWIVKGFLLDYAGDLVTYVFGYQSSKFYEVREAVVNRITEVIRTVCESDENYDAVIVLAHSQGTIVGYDAINRYCLKPKDKPIPLKAFVTFGSPLDKIAYLFRSESGDGTPMRNALISSRQPLIDHEDLRRELRWWNVYSKHDIIAGKLEFFDPDPPRPDTCILNREDFLNVTPVSSHTEYSNHRGVPLALREAIAWATLGTPPKA